MCVPQSSSILVKIIQDQSQTRKSTKKNKSGPVVQKGFEFILFPTESTEHMIEGCWDLNYLKT